ncbi:hypothetical protein RV00_GL001931 [Enterococcus devriesei]|uniref:Uncharacterized protein n=1 Tax=Enterococcus devriesei TaxID=319970 RepID=A0A1L8SXF2_9ENTE|nr:hypothetical protein RV00_GL001931 [Enterococcus devriesei]
MKIKFIFLVFRKMSSYKRNSCQFPFASSVGLVEWYAKRESELFFAVYLVQK